MDKNSKLLIHFPDSSESFAYGVEYGRLLQKMQDGKEIIGNMVINKLKEKCS